MSTRSTIAVVASVLAVLVLAGCGGSGEEGVEPSTTVQAPVTVTTDEAALSDATVSGTAMDLSTRQPLTGVDIAFYKLPEGDGTPYVKTTTDALGRYSVDLDAGDWRAFATVFGHPQVNFDIVPSGGANKLITVPGATNVDFFLWSYE
jgi:hypothetical protein